MQVIRFVSVLALVACSFAPVQAGTYARTNVTFSQAVFLKPSGPNSTELPFQLAPLIFQQTRRKNLLSPADQPGAPVVAQGTLKVTPMEPIVFADVDTVQLNHRAHSRFSYTWVYPSGEVQGVRLTLNASGTPAVWEILGEERGEQLVFVSDSLEADARAQFGPPLKGRRYSIEASLAKAPHALVPRVIADAGVPMGPMVYVSRRTHDVATLACRCMPVQVKAILMTANYALIPITTPAEHELLAIVLEQTHTRLAYRPGQTPAEPRLALCLRLPEDF